MLQVPANPPQNHWLGEPVYEYDAPLGALVEHLPTFLRIPFGAHPRKDVIVRRGGARTRPIPVAVVSKSYALVQHAAIVRELTRALAARQLDPAPLRAHLALTEYGTRMALRVVLPDELAFEAPDGHRMALTFECFNSVDGSVSLFALVGWFRFVCANGLVVGTTCARLRRRHTASLTVDDFAGVLGDGVSAAVQDREAFGRWASAEVTRPRVADWVDSTVQEAWGPLAAARVYSIITTGYDGSVTARSRRFKPHERLVARQVRVPGANAPGEHAYAAAQALAWVAARRRDLGERRQWGEQTGAMMQRLLAA